MPLNGSTLPYVPPAADQSQQIRAINQIIDIINAFQQQISFSDGTNKRMIIGYQKNGFGEGKDFGIKISQEGIDVQNATDEELLFKLDLDTWFYYDKNTKKNFMQIGLMPDGTYGWVVANTGTNVEELYA